MLTSNTGQELAGKVLNLAVGKGHKAVALQEIEHALAEKVHDDADVAAVVEAVAEVNAAVPVLGVVGSQRLEDPQFDLAGLAILLYGPDDLDGDELLGGLVSCLYDLAKRALPEQLDHLICRQLSVPILSRINLHLLTPLGEIVVRDHDVVAVVVVNAHILAVRGLYCGQRASDGIPTGERVRVLTSGTTLMCTSRAFLGG